MKKLMILFITLVIVTLLFPNVLATTKEECENGGGEWFTPQVASTDEPDFTKKKLKPYCKCDTGFYWDDSLKSCENDQELRCTQTGGTWINNECQCPEGTVKWTEGFGCDMPGPEPKININAELSSNLGTESKLDEKSISYKSLLLIFIFILFFIIGIIIYSYLIKRKRRERNEEDEVQ